MAEEKMKKLLEMIDAKIEHIEDINADNRAIIVKLVKQNNQIVEFLKQVEIEDVTDSFTDLGLSTTNSKDSPKYETVKELVEEFIDKSSELQELEQELENHKDEITPGQMGEA
tara:strand:- start:163 stop:501 length:339 start_codon:yes stop_codon:yes gene_type:complete